MNCNRRHRIAIETWGWFDSARWIYARAKVELDATGITSRPTKELSASSQY